MNIASRYNGIEIALTRRFTSHRAIKNHFANNFNWRRFVKGLIARQVNVDSAKYIADITKNAIHNDRFYPYDNKVVIFFN